MIVTPAKQINLGINPENFSRFFFPIEKKIRAIKNPICKPEQRGHNCIHSPLISIKNEGF